METSANLILNALELKNAALDLKAKAQELGADDVQKWIAVIDESPYSVAQWAEALIEFESWASAQKRVLSFPHMLEYLSCCCESGMPAHLLSLSFLLQEYLLDHGVE